MYMFTIALGFSCLAVVQPSYHSGYGMYLNAVPDISSFGKLSYPLFNIQELGEYSHGEHHPEVITIEKTVQVKVPQPYPVHIQQKIPYPVPYKVPHIIKIPHVVKVTHPVPVEVVKTVPVHKHQEESYGIQKAQEESYGIQNVHDVEVAEADNVKSTLDSAAYSLYNDGHQNDWQGVSSQALTNPQTFTSSSDAYVSGQEVGVHTSRQTDVSVAQAEGYDNSGQYGNGQDYSADASSHTLVQQVENIKPISEQSQESQH